jgi:predicted transcriptional regulator
LTRTGQLAYYSLVPSKNKIPKALKRIADAAKKHPGATQKELANLTGCTPGNVSRLLHKYETDATDVKRYSDIIAEILDGMNLRILSSITDEQINATPLHQRAIAYGIFDDKAVRARGQATSIIDVRSLQLTVTTSTRELEILQAARAARARHSVHGEEQS